MTTFAAKLADDEVLIVAPVLGTFDALEFHRRFPSDGLYGLDVETTALTPLEQFDPDFEVRLIQFATESYAWVLDLADPQQYESARSLLSDPSVRFCSHTGMDVLSVFARLGIDITGRNVDTYTLARLARPDAQSDNDLKTLTTVYIGPQLAELDATLYERFTELWIAAGGRKNPSSANLNAYGWAAIEVTDPDYLVYAGMDAIACRRLVTVLIEASGVPAQLIKVELWLAAQANRIKIRGMCVDQQALDALSTRVKRVAGEARQRVVELTGVSPLSPMLRPHLTNVLGDDLKPVKADNDQHRRQHLPSDECRGCKTNLKTWAPGWLAEHGVDWHSWPGDRTPTGVPSLEKANIGFLRSYPLDEVGEQVVDELIRYRSVQDSLTKITGDKGIEGRVDRHGRLHPNLRSIGAVTGRMSSSAPNFQNFSKSRPEARGVFVPEPGHTLVTADFDQIELRVLAALAREQVMIDTILDGGDLHQLTADEIGVVRDVAKMTNFLIVYGGGGKALAQQAGIPLEDAYTAVDRHRKRYGRVQALSDWAALQPVIVNIAGRRIPAKPRASYANINYLVQSSARELLVAAWYRFAVEYGHGDLVWFPVHDELVLQVPDGQLEQVVVDVQTCMRFDFMGVPISASAVPLVDEFGRSRWMTSKLAEQHAKARASAWEQQTIGKTTVDQAVLPITLP